MIEEIEDRSRWKPRKPESQGYGQKTATPFAGLWVEDNRPWRRGLPAIIELLFAPLSPQGLFLSRGCNLLLNDAKPRFADPAKEVRYHRKPGNEVARALGPRRASLPENADLSSSRRMNS
jgi:hypothetical protein